ncbi:MAG TPA: PQQ-dependent sugar dehydrogenase, partial [Cytophagales bacterium]|nr:PQQ-dependent sugar dehydrogenase [Cytophagales bacterium]
MKYFKTLFLKKHFRVSMCSILVMAMGVVALSCKKKDENVTPEDEDGLTLTTVVEGADTPWQIAFIPDGRILFTERIGRVRVVEKGVLKPEPYLNLRDSTIEAGEAGLTGI